MPSIKITNDSMRNRLGAEWVDAGKFDSYLRLVDENGCKIDSDYQGRKYRIITKKERSFSLLKRFGRGLLGTGAVIGTLFLGLFSKSVRNLFTKSKESVRFAVLEPQQKSCSDHVPLKPSVSPEPENEEYRISKEELQQGITISEDIISKIQTSMNNILRNKEENSVKLYNGQRNHRVFALDDAPEYIFKMKARDDIRTLVGVPTLGKDDSMKARYQKMIHAQTVVRTHQLGLLVIPNAKLFTVNVGREEYEIIAERKLDINPQQSAQEQYFNDYAESLNETIRQLATFICNTGYSDVEWRNNPVLNNSLDDNGNRKIALIDIEEMDSKETGLFGRDSLRRGLVRCVNEEQGQIVKTVAEENGINTEGFAVAHEMRKQEIEDEIKLKEYYANKNITLGNEEILVDENLIDFPEYPDQIKKIRKVTKNLVEAMNDKISTTSADESVKGRRYIYINTRRWPFKGLGKKLIHGSVLSERYTDEEYANATYMGYVANKLIELGHIHKVVAHNSDGYFLQA